MLDKSRPFIISGLNVHTEDTTIKNGNIVISNGIIKDINQKDPVQINPDYKVLKFASNWHLIPGMIELHTHGAAGSDTMDGTLDSLDTISTNLIKEGVTSFLAATVATRESILEKALNNIRDYVSKRNKIGANLLGVNIEGSFLSPKKAGCQDIHQLIMPNITLFKHWQAISNNLIRIVTIAPELPNSLELIKYLHANNVIASLGHTNATYEQALTAIANGCSHATHLFNAMTKIHHREPGVAIAVLLNPKVTTEIIADGVHSHQAMLQLALKLKGVDKIVLVTDSIRAKYLSDGSYILGDFEVIVKDNIVRLIDGTLAGSVLKMDVAFRNMLKFTDCTLSDVIKMTSMNPAKQLDIFDSKGSISEGKDADLVILNDNLQVQATIVGGNLYEIGS